MTITAAGSRLALAALLNGAYVSLHTADPTGSNEVSVGGYARRPAAFAELGGVNPITFANNAVIEFPVATASWGTVTHFAIYDALTGGNMRCSGALAESKLVGRDDVIRYIANALRVYANG